MDYSNHIQRASDALKKMYNLCQEGRHKEAIEYGLEAIAEARMATLSVREIIGDDE